MYLLPTWQVVHLLRLLGWCNNYPLGEGVFITHSMGSAFITHSVDGAFITHSVSGEIITQST